MKILPIETKVEFGDPTQKIIVGWISAATIRKRSTIYEINYWLLDDLKTIWLHEDRFKVITETKKHIIGFNKKD